MFRQRLLVVWMAILLLSGMFLMGQDSWPPQECIDNDQDGYGNPADPSCDYPELDCDDGDADVNPGATEGPYGYVVCGDDADNDCDGLVDENDPGCEIPLSCQEILLAGLSWGSGLYWMDPDGSAGLDPFEAYCDMETDGGGWTLVLHTWYTGSCPLSSEWTATYADFENVPRGTPTTYQGIGTQSLYMMQLISFKGLADQASELRFESDDYAMHTVCEDFVMDAVYEIDCSNEATLRTELCGGYNPCFIDAGFTTVDTDHDLYAGNCAASYWNVGWWYDSCHKYNPTCTCFWTHYGGYSSKDPNTQHWSWWVR